MATTISELHERWWYRLIKVVNLVALVLGILLCLVMTHDFVGGFAAIDAEQTKVVCNPDRTPLWPDAPGDLTVKSLDIETPPSYLFRGDHIDLKAYFQSVTHSYSDDARRIFAACGNNNEINQKFDAYVLQRTFELTAANRAASSTAVLTEDQTEELREIANAQFQFQKEPRLTFTPRSFDIVPAYTYWPYIQTSVISLAILLLTFEIIRRIFYYIVLGNLFPKRIKKVI